MSKMIMVDGSPMKFQIWDTAGQEKVGLVVELGLRSSHRTQSQ